MFEFEDMGARWGITFLHTASYLPYNEIDDLVRIATEMYTNREDERPVMGMSHDGVYDGRMYTLKEVKTLGPFVGMVFYAELSTDKGEDHMEFLVSEQTASTHPTFSKN